MYNSLVLKPIQYVNGSVYLPGSKSVSNRVLLLSALCYGTTKITNLLNCDDTKYMLNALQLLGIKYDLFNQNRSCVIYGKGISILEQKKELTVFVGNAGTVFRPLTAILSLRENNIILTGDNRMKERPIEHLVDSLRQSGAKIKYINKKSYPPILLQGGFIGGTMELNGNISSQFLTAILMAAPLAMNDTIINIVGDLVSKPYIDLTINLMKVFGITIKNNSYKSFFIQGNQIYCTPEKYLVEGDATSASYFLAAAAIKGGSVTVHGIGENSIQGDIYFPKILKQIGANIIFGSNYVTCSRNYLDGFDLDLNNIPDAAMTLAMVALFSIEKSYLRNIYNWRVKETDRLSAMSTELKKIGAKVEEGSDYLSIIPPKKFSNATIHTYNDHRIAMCFSLLSLSNAIITILNPNCTKKTFPNYFEQLSKISQYYS
ncbi:3-phosphoshikimate 1-carboxyvinyltransferase [Buchnera aphidicola (Eriosoma lanigerum)]|uniref:3-phosphoshikimate 1-carboxyvinyltransferase n=1 Tax=Buchnera aphidicola TaxID=9 RepID=UPI0034642F7D